MDTPDKRQVKENDEYNSKYNKRQVYVGITIDEWVWNEAEKTDECSDQRNYAENFILEYFLSWIPGERSFY